MKKFVWILYALPLSLLFLGKKKKQTTQPDEDNEDMTARLKDAFTKVLDQYGVDNARKLEQLYRWETAHFKSRQFTQTFTPGMEIGSGKTSFPFGWTSLKEYASANNLQPDEFSTVSMPEGGTGKLKTFVAFPNLDDAVLFTAYVLNKRNWNPGAWYSTDQEAQRRYNEKLKGVVPRIVNQLLKS